MKKILALAVQALWPQAFARHAVGQPQSDLRRHAGRKQTQKASEQGGKKEQHGC